MLFLVVLGGAAILEAHRAYNQNSSEDISDLKAKEDAIIKQLETTQKDLQAARQAREEVCSELAALSVRHEALSQSNAELSAHASHLAEEKAVLEARNEALLERQDSLERCAEGLRAENGLLTVQFARLKARAEEERAEAESSLRSLKERVAEAVDAFSSGELSGGALVERLRDWGVEVRSADGLAALDSARSREERVEALGGLQVTMGDDWVANLQGMDDSRAARLMEKAAGGLPGSLAGAAQSADLIRRLPTPGKSAKAGSEAGSRQPARLLASADLAVPTAAEPSPSSDAAPGDTIKAITLGQGGASGPPGRPEAVPALALPSAEPQVEKKARAGKEALPSEEPRAKSRGFLFVKRAPTPRKQSARPGLFFGGGSGRVLGALEQGSLGEDLEVLGGRGSGALASR